MSQSYEQRNVAWDARAKLLGERAVLHVGHGTPQAQLEIWKKQKDAIFPIFEEAVKPLFEGYYAAHDSLPYLHTLDYGCGVGRWTGLLHQILGGEVLGVDPTQRFLDICNKNYEEKLKTTHITFARLENGHVPSDDGYFDVVYACMVLSTILDVEGGMFEYAVNEIKRVLRPGGVMFLIDNTSGPAHRPVVRSPYSISRTVDQYKKAFSWCDLELKGHYEDLGEINSIFYGRKQ